MNKTPLYDEHLKLEAKVIDFAGWQMPVRYQGITEEHQATRSAAGLFDVSHMGEILISGEEAEACINYLCCNDVSKIVDGQAQYSALLNEEGGVVDDLIIYRFNSEKYLLCVNASNTDIDFEWILKHNNSAAKVENLSSEFGQLALQGPKSVEILEGIIPGVAEINKFYFREFDWDGTSLIVARTGYTGEDGFEIYCPSDQTVKLWQSILEVGAGVVAPCGLGARDTLRLEAAYPLHGHELKPEIPALSSGLGWIVKLNKSTDFIGKAKLTELKAKNDYPRLVGFQLNNPGIAREETLLFDANNQQVGIVTSGTKTPTINKSIGMAIVKNSIMEPGQQLEAEVRNKRISAELVKLPFYHL